MAVTHFSGADLQTVLGFARPLLMVDHVTADPAAGRLTSQRLIDADEVVFQGHFPGHPILPGVLQLEAMRQTALVGLRAYAGPVWECTFLRSLLRAKFRKPVRPGDLLELTVDVLAAGPMAFQVQANCLVGGQLVSEARLLFTPLPQGADATTLPEGTPTPPVDIAPGQNPLDGAAIQGIIPHRDPFLFIDAISTQVDHQPEYTDLVAHKRIPPTAPYLAGAGPLIAPTLLTEMAAQAGSANVLGLPRNQGKIGYFLSLDDVCFLRPVPASSELRIVVRMGAMRERFGRGFGWIYAGPDLVSVQEIRFAVVDP